MKKAFITGITGQDGSYLAELLLDKGYKVYGLTRRTSTQNYARIAHLMHNENLELVSGDLIALFIRIEMELAFTAFEFVNMKYLGV